MRKRSPVFPGDDMAFRTANTLNQAAILKIITGIIRMLNCIVYNDVINSITGQLQWY